MWHHRAATHRPRFRPARRSLALLLVLLVGAITIGLVVGALRPASVADETVSSATLAFESTPAGATVELDERVAGVTPLTLPAPPGSYRVVVRAAGFLDSPPQVVAALAGETVAVQVTLWSATPQLLPLRPPGVGQTIADATVISSERIALTVTPARQPDQRELWVQTTAGHLERTGPPRPVPILAITPDGGVVAYAIAGLAATARPTSSERGQPRLDELWITRQPGDVGQRRLTLAADPTLKGATLTGLLWAPDGQHLVATALDRRPDGSAVTTVLWLPVTGGTVQRLPSIAGEIVPGSWAWSPDGERVAFLAEERGRATTVLALLTPAATGATDQLRNLADAVVVEGGRLPTSPLLWTPDGRAILAPLPVATAGGLLGLGGGGRPGYGLSEPGPRPPLPLPGLTGLAPGWRDAGTLLTLQASRDGQLTVLQTPLDSAGLLDGPASHLSPPSPTSGVARPTAVRSTTLTTVPLRVTGAAIGARWDGAHRQLLLVMPGRSGGRDDLTWWWVRW